MTPETIFVTVQALALAITEIFRWLQTPEGRDVVRKSLEDREAAERFLRDLGHGIKALLEGKLPGGA